MFERFVRGYTRKIRLWSVRKGLPLKIESSNKFAGRAQEAYLKEVHETYPKMLYFADISKDVLGYFGMEKTTYSTISNLIFSGQLLFHDSVLLFRRRLFGV